MPPSKTLSAGAASAWFALAYLCLYTLMQLLRPALAGALGIEDLRPMVAFRIGCSALFLWLMFAVAAWLMRAQGLRLADLGFDRGGRSAGWAVALAIAGLHVAAMAAGPLRQFPIGSDWSLWRVGCALAVAVSAGTCEETLFRGFIMGQARALGLPAWAQAVVSGLLFGLAHAAWGLMTGSFDAASAMGAMVSTGVLGLLLAIAYLVGGRSLWPVIIAHGLLDLVEEPWLMSFAISGGFGSAH